VVVAQDGTGQHTTIQAALDAIPEDNSTHTIVLVRRGTYREKLFVTKSHVSIVGEDRETTRIVFAELRRTWRETHPDDWGAAVVNIGPDVTDLVLANLTVRNDHGAIHGDRDHQFAIRSGGNATRIAILHANVIADGGDTLSLWNAASGLSYHSDCYFEGWVDYVCPRGWCYITNSRFFGRNTSSASIWHDGSQHPSQKLVIRQSRFDGVPGFPLGRHNRDGQFFLLDATFGANMANRPVYPASPAETYKFPPRYYYWNAHREGGDFPWFADNLETAGGAPSEANVTAEWTFGGRWDPENTLPPVLPFAAVPRPRHLGTRVDPTRVTLRWVAARDATAHDIAFGTTNPPRRLRHVTSTSLDVGSLRPATTYYWRVDAITPAGRVPGAVWQFTTGARQRQGARASAGAPTALPPVRVVLVGDSTMTNEKGWGRGFCARLDERATCVNVAKGGRSSKSYLDEGHWQAAPIQPGDIVLIQFGHNDGPGKGPERETDPSTTFRSNLSRFVDEARSRKAVPVLVTSLTRRRWNAAGRVESDLGPYADAARAVAFDKGIAVIDLHRLSIAALDRLGPVASSGLGPLAPDHTIDRTHLSERGSLLFGGLVANEVRRLVPALAPYVLDATTAWNHVLDQPDAWYGGEEARRIAGNVRLFQRAAGGWPKNVDMARRLTAEERARLAADRALADATIDNGATVTQLRFLARVHAATRDGRLSASVLGGLDYLLDAQYPNGGWPQFHPLRDDYTRDVTFNDDAMVNVLRLLDDVAAGRAPFAWVDENRRRRARDAVARGIDLILATQVRANGRLTIWAAQYDPGTLAPAAARSFEPAALATRESASIVTFLSERAQPRAEIAAAIEAARAWFTASQIRGLRVEDRLDASAPLGWDRSVVADPSAPPVWARFYDIATNDPVFMGRDGVAKGALADIEYERRTGYAWFGTWPKGILER
jgi:PelA/Pel-15E family pectate lyase